MQHWLSPTLYPVSPSHSLSLSLAIAISVYLHCPAKVYLICVRHQRCWWLFRQGRRGLTDTPTIHAYKNNKYWFDDVRRKRGGGDRQGGGGGGREVCQRCCLPFWRMLLIILAAAWRGYMYAKRLSHKSGRNPPLRFASTTPRQCLHCAKRVKKLLHI